MDDQSMFMLERSAFSNCASKYFGKVELPTSPEECIETAIAWAAQRDNPPIAILGRRFLCTALKLPSFEVSSD